MPPGEAPRLRAKGSDTPLTKQGQERLWGERHTLSGLHPHEVVALPIINHPMQHLIVYPRNTLFAFYRTPEEGPYNGAKSYPYSRGREQGTGTFR